MDKFEKFSLERLIDREIWVRHENRHVVEF
jgi:hypothetical protein